MASDRSLSDIVTEFLLNTCRIHPQVSRHRVQAALNCGHKAARLSGVDNDIIPFVAGSAAELYIEPMLSCRPNIGDDIMAYHRSQLAIRRGHPPPTQLPAEFDNYVKVYEILEITDSILPGYVYLELRYLLTKCIDDAEAQKSMTGDRLYHSTDTLIGIRMDRHYIIPHKIELNLIYQLT